MWNPTNLQFECRVTVEAYPRPGETAAEVLTRGDYQEVKTRILRFRTYDLDDGRECNFSDWIEMPEARREVSTRGTRLEWNAIPERIAPSELTLFAQRAAEDV